MQLHGWTEYANELGPLTGSHVPHTEARSFGAHLVVGGSSKHVGFDSRAPSQSRRAVNVSEKPLFGVHVHVPIAASVSASMPASPGSGAGFSEHASRASDKKPKSFGVMRGGP